jgi:hypothetical protein
MCKLHSAAGGTHRQPLSPSCNVIEDTDSDPSTLAREWEIALSGLVAMAPTCAALTSCPPLSCCWPEAATARKHSSIEAVTSWWDIVVINIDP